MKHLNNEEINAELEKLTGWTFSEDKILREFVFKNFKESLSFIVRVGFEAESIGHHPVIENVYNKVKISLQTHDVGNKVTEKDLELAKKIDAINP